jgi:surface polysaccharide O-acyltransferase-like enzyme
VAAQPVTIQNAENQPPASADGKRPVIYWADLIRVLAIYLVVVIHVSGQLTNAWGQIPASQWITADILGGIARVGVPLFFMLSGFLLLPRSESLRDFYGKRMLRIVIPFIFWSVFYISLDCIGHPGMCTRQYLLPYVLLQRSYFHLWFLYSLIAIYFIVPLLRLLVRPGTDVTFLWYLIALWLIFQPIRTLMDQFLHFSININAQLTTGFLPYFILGYLLGNLPLTRGRITAAGAVFVISVLITIVGTYLLTRASGRFNGYFYDYVTLGVILSTGAAFVLLRAASDAGFLANERFHSLMRWVAGGTFGVYLIHVMFIWGLDRLSINSFMGFALWSVPLVATLVFVMSFLVVRAFQKIPFMNYILPG